MRHNLERCAITWQNAAGNGLIFLAEMTKTVFMYSNKSIDKPVGAANVLLACEPAPETRPVRLLDPLRERVRYKQDSIRTGQQYVHWVKDFVRFHGLRHPRGPGAAATHNQALATSCLF